VEYKCVLMENFDKALNLEQISLESAGSAMVKFNIYQKSGAAASERLKNEFEKLFLQIDSGFIKGLINAGGEILKFINITGGLRTILIAIIGLLAILKGQAIVTALASLLVPLKAILTTLSLLRTAMIVNSATAMGYGKALVFLGATATTAQLALGAIVAVLAIASISFGVAKAKQEELAQKTKEATRGFVEQRQALDNLYLKTKEIIDSADTEQSKRQQLLDIIIQTNSAYKEEAENISNVTELRVYATSKIKEENEARARAFFADAEEQYQKAKSFFEEGTFKVQQGLSSPLKMSVKIDDPVKELENLSVAISDLALKRASGIEVSKLEIFNLGLLQERYGVIKSKHDDLIGVYEQGNIALSILNGTYVATNDTLDNATEAFVNYSISAKESTNAVTELSNVLGELDGVLEKVREGEEFSGEEIIKLLDLYPELYDSIRMTATGYEIEASALEKIRQVRISAAEEQINNSVIAAKDVLKSQGIIIGAYGNEVSAIIELIDAQLELAKIRHSPALLLHERRMSPDTPGVFDSLYFKKRETELKATKRALVEIAAAQKSLELMKSGLTTTASTKESSKDKTKRLKSEAEALKKEQEARAKALKKEQEERLKTSIDITMNRINAERKAVEDSFNAQIELLKKTNEERQDEIDLINAKDKLLNAQGQKIKRTYYEGQGWVWEADKQAIKDAEESLVKLNQEAEVRKAEESRDIALAKEDKKMESYEAVLLAMMKTSKDEGTKAVIGGTLGLTEYKGGWYNGSGQKVFKNGGLANFTGSAWMDGSLTKPEIAINNQQAAGLFNWIKSLGELSGTRPALATSGGGKTINIGTVNLPSVTNGMGFVRELELISKNR